MVTAATSAGICFLNFSDKVTDFPIPDEDKNDVAQRHILTLKQELKEYFESGRKEFSVALDIFGTGFCTMVWKELLKVPYGTTTTYIQQANSLKIPKSVRAVAKANALNRIVILIPCHRIIGSNGKLTGYSGGIDRKRWLLLHEKKYSLPIDNELFDIT